MVGGVFLGVCVEGLKRKAELERVREKEERKEKKSWEEKEEKGRRRKRGEGEREKNSETHSWKDPCSLNVGVESRLSSVPCSFSSPLFLSPFRRTLPKERKGRRGKDEKTTPSSS